MTESINYYHKSQPISVHKNHMYTHP